MVGTQYNLRSSIRNKAPNDTLYPVSAATGERVNSIQMVIYSKTGSYRAYIFAIRL